MKKEIKYKVERYRYGNYITWIVLRSVNGGMWWVVKGDISYEEAHNLLEDHDRIERLVKKNRITGVCLCIFMMVMGILLYFDKL